MVNRRRGRSRTPSLKKPAPKRPPSHEQPPKAGPGQLLVEEKFVVMGEVAPRTRLRNQAEHPLLLAFHKGQLESEYPASVPKENRITARERFDVGEEYRNHFERIHRTGRDSLDMTARGGSLTDKDFKQLSRAWLKKLHGDPINGVAGKLHPRDGLVILKFCGEGFSIPEALRSAHILFHPNSAAWRMREALDELVYAVTGRRSLPEIGQMIA